MKSRTRLHCHFYFSLSCIGEEMATHSSILAWRIPGKESLVGCHLCGRTELDTTEATQQQQQHTSKIMLKILQVRLQQYMHHELPEVQAGFRKGRGTRDQIANIHPIIEKGREFQENIYSALLTMPKPLTMWITTNYGKYHTI